jgi:hypothetical protein
MRYLCDNCGRVTKICELDAVNIIDRDIPHICPWGHGQVRWKEAQQDTKVDLQTAPNKPHASCANCRKNIDDLRCESGGWNGSGSCTMWAPRNQHP